jgi:bifunctional DNA primase/polymerase-like protein
VTTVQEMADSWRRAGAYPLPKHPNRKAPMLREWQGFAHAPVPAVIHAEQWAGICVPMGGISRIEGLDFDSDEADGQKTPGSAMAAFQAWLTGLRSQAPALAEKVVTHGYVEQSPSGGVHLYIRYAVGDVPGNEKWARYASGKTKIETRGTGGQFVVAPSPGYTALIGRPENIPVVMSDERNYLKAMAHVFNEKIEAPGEEEIGEVREGDGEAYVSPRGWDGILEDTGWTEVTVHSSSLRNGFDQAWARPGHVASPDSGEYSAVSSSVCLMVFSSTAISMFEDAGVKGREQKNGSMVYTMSEVYAALHDGASLAGDDQALLFGATQGSPLVPITHPAPPAPEEEAALESMYVLPKTSVKDQTGIALAKQMNRTLQ